MASQFRVELAGEDEIPSLVAMMVPAFAQYSIERVLGNVDTPEGIQAATQRHSRAVREHLEETGRPCAVKCVETTSGSNIIAACAYWMIFDKPQSPDNARKTNYLFTAEWLDEDQKEKAKSAFKPMLDMHFKWTKGRGHGDLLYMATDPAWRRKGAATAVVQWGVDLCKELGIPAYLEASPAGRPVYERLGFETVDNIESEADGEKNAFPAMMWWPPGTKEEDKGPMEG